MKKTSPCPINAYNLRCNWKIDSRTAIFNHYNVARWFASVPWVSTSVPQGYQLVGPMGDVNPNPLQLCLASCQNLMGCVCRQFLCLVLIEVSLLSCGCLCILPALCTCSWTSNAGVASPNHNTRTLRWIKLALRMCCDGFPHRCDHLIKSEQDNGHVCFPQSWHCSQLRLGSWLRKGELTV